MATVALESRGSPELLAAGRSELFGVAPALPGDANFDYYRTGLLEARSLMGAAYNFDDADVETW